MWGTSYRTAKVAQILQKLPKKKYIKSYAIVGCPFGHKADLLFGQFLNILANFCTCLLYFFGNLYPWTTFLLFWVTFVA